MKFKQQINKIELFIKLAFNFSLDTVVYQTQSGKLEIKLYRKESDPQSYINRKSEHTEFLK